MPNINTELQLKASFYHSLGKVITLDTNLAGNELYKSAHNIRSIDVWLDDVPYSGDLSTSFLNSDNVLVKQIGTISNPVYLYPLLGTDYQTWFIDTGTPSIGGNGFIPSEGLVKSLISPSDVPNEIGAPSLGYELRMYRNNGTNPISYNLSFYEVDYYSGLIRFDVNKTPKDQINGLGFQFDSISFEESLDKLSYINNPTTGGPRVIAFQYVGRKLSDIDFNNLGPSYSYGIGITISNNEISVDIDDSTIKVNDENKLYVYGNIIYQEQNSLVTIGDNQPTGLTISNNLSDYSDIKVYINGMAQPIGDGSTNSNCYFNNDLTGVVDLNDISIGDELYWNFNISGFDLEENDIILVTYISPD